MHPIDDRAAGFEAGDQAGIRNSVFLQADDEIGDRQPLVERGQELTPGIRLGNDERRRDADFLERGERLGTADDRFDVAHGGEELSAVDVPLDLCEEVSRADAGQKDHDVDLPGDETIGEVDRGLIVRERHFAHRRTDVRHAVAALDQARNVVGATTFERRDTKSGERGGGGAHWVHSSCDRAGVRG